MRKVLSICKIWKCIRREGIRRWLFPLLKKPDSSSHISWIIFLVLSPLLQPPLFYLKNIAHFLSRIDEINVKQSRGEFASFDIENFYTNADRKDALRTLSTLVSNHSISFCTYDFQS
ncbi:hypothetical protein AB6A40_007276 [Gnathostoma spinigerum]|uniref:Reverse transcriptase domain-containing protein n=1 Tax=Gnathostoma spinigerum TaxID=75299 RepID=A0ABD6EV56_9BILA